MNRNYIKKALQDRGFTGTIDLYFWNNDGWYCDCDQMLHDWIGQNAKHAIQKIKRGDFDDWIGSRTPSN